MGPLEEWGLSDAEAIENIIHGNILFAMAQHTFDFANLNEINSLSDILVLSDDLEEFSRFGRPLLSRKYYHTTANVTFTFDPEYPSKDSNNVKLEITYEVEDPLSETGYYYFFYRKASQLCKIYSLEEKSDQDFCKLTTIKMIVKHNYNELYFQLSSNEDEILGKLPKKDFPIENLKGYQDELKKLAAEKGQIDRITFNDEVYKMRCLDDKLYIRATEIYEEITEDILLKDWLGIKEEE